MARTAGCDIEGERRSGADRPNSQLLESSSASVNSAIENANSGRSERCRHGPASAASCAGSRSKNPHRTARKLGHEPGLSRAGLGAEAPATKEVIARILGQPSRADLATRGWARAACRG